MDSSDSREDTREAVDLSHFSPSKLHTDTLSHALCERFGAIIYEVSKEHIAIVLATPSKEQESLIAHHLSPLAKEIHFYRESSYCFYWILRGARFVENFAMRENVESKLLFLLQEAIALGASDIHIEQKTQCATIRLRLDGILRELGRIELEEFAKLASKIKLDSKLDITESRLPQDGRMRKNVEKKEYDLRISCVPLLHGESIVLRILYQHDTLLSLRALGLAPATAEALLESIAKKSGLILVVGPTGSGKSTTLYALLEEVKNLAKKIVTIEDPIEYQVPAATQIQLNPDLGFSFYEALKCTLRQDPDIIMVGEIRDRQTLELALNASLTGHLVLASLHSHDCISSLERLFEMGAARSVVATSLLCIVAQRLVGRLCDSCKHEEEAGFIARGCECCNGSGIKGRVVIAQHLQIDESLRRLFWGGQESRGEAGGSRGKEGERGGEEGGESEGDREGGNVEGESHKASEQLGDNWRLSLREALIARKLPTLKDDALSKSELIDHREIAALE